MVVIDNGQISAVASGADLPAPNPDEYPETALFGYYLHKEQGGSEVKIYGPGADVTSDSGQQISSNDHQSPMIGPFNAQTLAYSKVRVTDSTGTLVGYTLYWLNERG